jgi:hypothetical protein
VTAQTKALQETLDPQKLFAGYAEQLNAQKQTPYAADNGMGASLYSGPLGSNASGSGSTASSIPTGTTPQAPAQSAPTQPQQTAVAQATGQSPVTANGKINETLQPAAAQPAPQPQPQAQPAATGAGAPGPGWTPYGDGGWLPPGHPAAQTAAPAGSASGAQLAQQPPGTTLGALGNPAQELVAPGVVPTLSGGANYTVGNLSQYGGGLNPALESAVQDALMQALAGGGGLPVEQLKARYKEDATGMRDDNLQASSGLMASAGRTGSGYAGSQASDIRSQTIEQILGGYRDIDIADALARNEFGLRGIETGNQFLTGQVGRNQSDYQTQISGQLAQENLGLAGAANNRANYLAQLESALGLKGIDLQSSLGHLAAGTDKYRTNAQLIASLLGIMEGGRATDIGAGIDWGRIFAGSM